MKKLFLLLFLNLALNAQSLNKDFLTDQKSKIKLENKISVMSKNEVFTKKKTGLAIIYSLLLPGMGELYAGSYNSGKYFTIADGVFWGSFIGFNVYGKWQENNYKEYAATVGGADVSGKKDKYFADLGNYLDIDQYNHAKELNRQFEQTYDVRTHYWKWSGQVQRKEYRNMWLSSEQAYNNIRFAVGALLLNRLASAVNAVRLVVKHNKKLKAEKVGWNIYFGVEQVSPQQSNFTVNLTRAF
jgi:hypothetical protein